MNIPGIYSVFENANIVALCSDPWPQVLALLGQAGERIMIDLLIDCSIFLRVHSGYNNYYQLNGARLGLSYVVASADLDQGYHCSSMLLHPMLRISALKVSKRNLRLHLRFL